MIKKEIADIIQNKSIGTEKRNIFLYSSEPYKTFKFKGASPVLFLNFNRI